jgi:hypothetical protein
LAPSTAAAAAADWAWPARQSNPEQFLKHSLATHLLTLWIRADQEANMEAKNAGGVVGPEEKTSSIAWPVTLFIRDMCCLSKLQQR